MHLEMATRVPSTATAKMSIHSTMRCDARVASRQNRRRACAGAPREKGTPCSAGVSLERETSQEQRCCGIDFGRPLRLPPPHAHGQRQPDAMARHRVPAIEVGEHERSRICVRHDHLRNQRTRRPARATGRAGRARMREPERAERRARCAAGPADRGLIDHRPGTEQSPVQARAAQPLEVDPVGPVGGLHLGQLDAATAGRVDVEERRARQEPADRLLRCREASPRW